jgi:peroxiredoxin
MPALQEIHNKYQPDGLAILALNQDEPVEVAREYFYDEMDLSFTPLQDTNSSVAADYGGLNVLPTTYFIDSDGIISAIHHGPMTVGQIEGYLTEMVPVSQ